MLRQAAAAGCGRRRGGARRPRGRRPTARRWPAGTARASRRAGRPARTRAAVRRRRRRAAKRRPDRGPRSTETTRSAWTIALTATATTPSAASSALPMPSDSSAVRGGVDVQLEVGGDRRVRGQAAEDQVRVGHRRLGAAAAVARGSGVGARALRADAQRAAAVHPADRAAAGADRVDVDHRQADRQPRDLALHGELGLGAALGEEERVAARPAHVEAHGGRLGDDPRGDRPAGRAAQQHRRRVRGGLLERGHAAAGKHHVRLGQPGRLGRLAQPAEVAAGRRAERRVDRDRRRALELPHLGGHLVRGDDEGIRQRLAQQLGHALLVRRIAEREEQADGDGLDAGAREAPGRLRHARLVELADHVRRAPSARRPPRSAAARRPAASAPRAAGRGSAAPGGRGRAGRGSPWW